VIVIWSSALSSPRRYLSYDFPHCYLGKSCANDGQEGTKSDQSPRKTVAMPKGFEAEPSL
jgi:hypothetical protein